MRRYVIPADPAATILDPLRGRPVPADGLEVDWNPYWAGLEMRGDVIVSELPAEAPAPEPKKSKPAA